MKVLVAADSFKGSLTSKEIGEAFAKQIKNCNYVEIADGGEGSLETIKGLVKCEQVDLEVMNMNYQRQQTYYLLDKDTKTAYIESALIVSITDPLVDLIAVDKRSSYGIGMIINHAINMGANNIVIFLGGTATNDCGLGMLEALGMSYYDNNDNLISKIKPENFSNIKSIKNNIALDKVNITICSDVTNPLCGKNGASFIYGPQKGLVKVRETDELFLHAAKLINEENIVLSGAGAAGGLGYALSLFKNAKFISGFDYISNLANLEQQISNADLIITGEGKFDSQSMNGKVVSKIATLTKKHNKNLIVICGIKECQNYFSEIEKIYQISPENQDLEFAIKNAKSNLNFTIQVIMSDLNLNAC